MNALQVKILDRLQQLPESLLGEILNYIDFLLWRKSIKQSESLSVSSLDIPTEEVNRSTVTDQWPKPSVQDLMVMAQQFAELPDLDKRNAVEILGYNEFGLPS